MAVRTVIDGTTYVLVEEIEVDRMENEIFSLYKRLDILIQKTKTLETELARQANIFISQG